MAPFRSFFACLSYVLLRAEAYLFLLLFDFHAYPLGKNVHSLLREFCKPAPRALCGRCHPDRMVLVRPLPPRDTMLKPGETPSCGIKYCCFYFRFAELWPWIVFICKLHRARRCYCCYCGCTVVVSSVGTTLSEARASRRKLKERELERTCSRVACASVL